MNPSKAKHEKRFLLKWSQLISKSSGSPVNGFCGCCKAMSPLQRWRGMDKREVHIFPPSLRPSSLCSLVFTFNSLTSSPCSLLSHLLHSPVFFLYPNRNCSRQKGKKRRSLIVYYYRQHKHTQRRREKHSKEMLSLHTSSSPTLPFHHSTFQPKACKSFLPHYDPTQF